ncbi:uncharacterized protein FIBRA_08730 [Fibroporia radiculosa]|uniref:Uncharacterized protein n=1 Tax=Fibroporia radiculosa TaxID=599839 RepID=J4GXB8_9APHY|nr:uncharacterized protein FIBRA_08730 [Fibroporia radiculosa]CCM06465.1 predicted protein [Fibroporia radiculosa]
METVTDVEVHLIQLLGSMRLEGGWDKPSSVSSPTSIKISTSINGTAEKNSPRIDGGSPPQDSDTIMSNSIDTEDLHYQHPHGHPAASVNENENARPPCGCALVQALRGLIRAGTYPATSGEYLEAIFTHREAFYAFPQGHRTCAIGFSDLAVDLERRQYVVKADVDEVAATAFRHEAWVIASSSRW